jgi:hypothetical protein
VGVALAELEARFEQLARIGRNEDDRDIYVAELLGILVESVLELASQVDELSTEAEALRRRLAERP